jgi:hypothetical protein
MDRTGEDGAMCLEDPFRGIVGYGSTRTPSMAQPQPIA